MPAPAQWCVNTAHDILYGALLTLTHYLEEHELPEQVYVFDVVLAANTSSTAITGPGRIWIRYQNILPEVLFDPGIQLIPSWHLFGFMDMTVRRYIRPSFSGMLGFSEVHRSVNAVTASA